MHEDKNENYDIYGRHWPQDEQEEGDSNPIIPLTMPELYTIFSQRLLGHVLGQSETVNPPAHHEGWMVGGQETLLHWVPVPYLS